MVDPVEDETGAAKAILLGLKPHDQRELVAAEADQQIGVADPGGKPPARFAKQLVTCMVTVGVVDLLEVIEVDEHQRDAIGGLSLRDPPLADLEESAAIPESRQVVGDGLPMRVR